MYPIMCFRNKVNSNNLKCLSCLALAATEPGTSATRLSFDQNSKFMLFIFTHSKCQND